MMLGASRPTVTVVAGTLQSAGLITYHRGRITIVDREKLEAASCECYRVSADLLKQVTSAAPNLATRVRRVLPNEVFAGQEEARRRSRPSRQT
jgi:hypothetical protein